MLVHAFLLLLFTPSFLSYLSIFANHSWDLAIKPPVNERLGITPAKFLTLSLICKFVHVFFLWTCICQLSQTYFWGSSDGPSPLNNPVHIHTVLMTIFQVNPGSQLLPWLPFSICSYFVQCIFGSGTYSISLLVLLLGWCSSKKNPKTPSCEIGSRWNLAGLFFR